MTVAPRARRRDRFDVSKLPFLRERLRLLRCVRSRFEVFVTLVVSRFGKGLVLDDCDTARVEDRLPGEGFSSEE